MQTLYAIQAVFSESAATVALLVSGVSTRHYSHRFKNFIYSKIYLNLYQLLIYSSSLLVVFLISSFTYYSSYK